MHMQSVMAYLAPLFVFLLLLQSCELIWQFPHLLHHNLNLEFLTPFYFSLVLSINLEISNSTSVSLSKNLKLESDKPKSKNSILRLWVLFLLRIPDEPPCYIPGLGQ